MDSVVTHDVSHQEMNKEWCSYSKKNTKNSMEHIRKLLRQEKWCYFDLKSLLYKDMTWTA